MAESAAAANSWQHFAAWQCPVSGLGFNLDCSRSTLSEAHLVDRAGLIELAFSAMDQLESGSLANPDEQRMVGHYWLRDADRAPTAELAAQILRDIAQVKGLADRVLAGHLRPQTAERFEHLLVIGIGGSALGPQLVADALGPARTGLAVQFLDNTDPDGIARTLGHLHRWLARTLCVVISKSGGTPETRNGMILAQAAYQAAGLDFPRHAIAVTGTSGALHSAATSGQWLAIVPMHDWVGGRTSVTSAVGLLPAALQGLDIDALLAGAAAMDQATRLKDARRNPAMLLAIAWHVLTDGRGSRDMVVLPYKDRLLLLSRYLQQLVMESLGKGTDLSGRAVRQGISVYGNKGSTDQHAYVQQLREGLDNFFAVFIRVLEDGGAAAEVEPQITAGDYLDGFLQGTRTALWEAGRPSLTISIPRVEARTLGALIALFERAVGFYASLVNINAYHQPGVEAGKKAAAAVLARQLKLVAALSDTPATAVQLAAAIGEPGRAEEAYLILTHLAANGRAACAGGQDVAGQTFARMGG